MANVLLVEDNQTNLRLMVYLLRAFGHQTNTASNGQEAIAAARGSRPDIVLMDLHMPVMDGFEAADRIRGLPGMEDVPVIAVTASAMVGDRDKILARGFQGYIAKPITAETFVQQVERYLPGHPAR